MRSAMTRRECSTTASVGTLVMRRVAWHGNLGDRPHRNARSGNCGERPRHDRAAAHVNSISDRIAMLVGRAARPSTEMRRSPRTRTSAHRRRHVGRDHQRWRTRCVVSVTVCGVTRGDVVQCGVGRSIAYGGVSYTIVSDVGCGVR